ncbi:BMP family protein [Microlunatus capsulatus]|uniref:Basic membrane protein A n=1 Tax=Microlunatus capsulatus TaxID=99117 RepID=A0ABS4Z6T4_9ACTN|nr:BMP family ABC transporter substrate-binding protein [Microlunatus capsulatus]MBP2416427.1 basic membrane protein A [Microlunatus capsulatus]
MKKSLFAGSALGAAVLLTLGACAEAPGTAEPGASTSASAGASASGAAADFKACMVSDSGGFDDKSFNQTSYKGLTDAATSLGIQTGQIESNADADYATNVQSMIDANCKIIVTVGFKLADTTLAAAKANPDVDFAIVDSNDPKFAGVENLKPLVFNTAESSFMAGYLAAGMSQTKKVGTFGGLKIPTVTIFMDGFAQGVDYYNEKKSADVAVLGWDVSKQDGQFTGDFEDQKGGANTAGNLISQGADVILPVAGPAGLGALQAAKASSGKVNAIWVDTDGCVSAEQYCPQIISSVYKGLDVSVTDAIKASQDGSFSSEPYVGTLENGGTGLSPFNQFDSKVPAELKTELETIKTDIESGSITIESKSQPSS